MVERLAHFLTGWVEFEVRGNGPRFFNTAAKAGVEFWGFSRRGERLSARGTPGDYKRLRELARRSGAHPTIVARGGLPFTTARLRRRKGLVVGAAAGTAVYLFLSGFCWGVTVTGAETLTRLQVLEAARQSGLSVGAPLREMDYKAVALSIQNRLEGVTWLSVNNNGCFVEVSLRESLPAPEVVNDREWSNMVAARPGTILSVEAERGRPVVSPGDTVTAGQLLIAGLYEQELDPYSPPPDEPYQVLGAARGSVRALTYREFSVEVPQEKTVLVPTGRRSQAALEVFGLRVPLGLARSAGGELPGVAVLHRLEPPGPGLAPCLGGDHLGDLPGGGCAPGGGRPGGGRLAGLAAPPAGGAAPWQQGGGGGALLHRGGSRPPVKGRVQM